MDAFVPRSTNSSEQVTYWTSTASFAVTTGDSSDKFTTLWELSDKEFRQRIIPVIYLAILMVIGIPGNLSVIFVYFKHVKASTHTNFLIILGTIDLSACAIHIPFEITEMRFQYTFFAEGACKFFRGLSVLLALSSIFVLLTLSIDRFRRVCKPLKQQISPRQAIKVCLLMVGVALLLSLPNFFISGTRHVSFKQPDNSTIVGHDCSVSDKYIKTRFPTIYNGVLFLIFLSTAIALIVMYSCMGCKIRAHGKFRSRFSSKNSSISTENTNSTSADAEESVQLKSVSKKSGLSLKKSVSGNKKNVRPSKKNTDDDKSAKITKIALAISIAFILSYLPHLTLSVMTAVKGRFIAKPSPLVLALFPILTRSTFINNVINPFIYAALDPKFRQGLKKSLCCRG